MDPEPAMLPTVNGHSSATNGHRSSSPSAPALSSDELLSIDGFIRDKTWLITGVTGFLGTVLVSLITSAARKGASQEARFAALMRQP